MQILTDLTPLFYLSDSLYLSAFFLFLLGLAVGVIAAIFGVGGGFFFTPFFHSILHLSAPAAVATSMAQIPFLSASGAWQYHKKNMINFSESFKLLLVSIPAAQIIAYFTGNINETQWGRQPFTEGTNNADILIGGIYSVTLVVLGAYSIIKGLRESRRKKSGELRPAPRKNWYYYVMAGLIFGAMSAVLGIGGGFLAVPFFMYFSGLKPIEAVATSLFSIFIIAFVTSINYLSAGHVYLSISLISALGTTLGAQVGSRLAAGIRASALRASFGLFQILIVLLYIYFKFI